MAPTVLQRLRLKARHGLLIQEILDTLGRWGLGFYPYIVYREFEIPGDNEGKEDLAVEYRELRPDEAALIATIEGRKMSESNVRARFAANGIAFGAFQSNRLIAYTWANIRHFPGLGDSPPVRELKNNEAYLYDAYTIREFRGKDIIPRLRTCLYNALRARGRDDFYSISFYFNRSARRFKEKLGARESEIRFSMNVFGRVRKDILIRTRPE